MSTKVHDFASQVQYAASINPAVYTTATLEGSAIDLLGSDGRGFAVLHAGTIGGGTSVDAQLEHSTDGLIWGPIAGATFPNVAAGPATHVIGFDRAQRYVRAAADLTGGSPSANLCVAIGQQKKTI